MHLPSAYVDAITLSAYADNVIDLEELAKTGTEAVDPADGLQAVAALRRLAEDLEVLHVQRARAQGLSWREVASALGVTKQTVHRKHQALEASDGRGGRS